MLCVVCRSIEARPPVTVDGDISLDAIDEMLAGCTCAGRRGRAHPIRHAAERARDDRRAANALGYEPCPNAAHCGGMTRDGGMCGGCVTRSARYSDDAVDWYLDHGYPVDDIAYRLGVRVELIRALATHIADEAAA